MNKAQINRDRQNDEKVPPETAQMIRLNLRRIKKYSGYASATYTVSPRDRTDPPDFMSYT